MEDDLLGAYDELLHGHKAEPQHSLPTVLCAFYNKPLRVVLDEYARYDGGSDCYEGELIDVGQEFLVLYHKQFHRTLIIMYKSIMAIEIWQTTKPEENPEKEG